MAMMTYWEQRTQKNNAKAQKQAHKYSLLEKKLFKDALKEINNALNELLVMDISGLSRTELWRMAKYINLREIIEQKCGGIATGQIHLVEQALDEVFESTIGATRTSFTNTTFNLVTDQLRQQIINTEWSGKSYSSRIWTNTSVLSSKLQKSIEDMIILGKSSNEIKRQLAADMGVAWRMADRLIRTESAHMHTEAAKASYKASGVKQVKWINGGAGALGCDLCASRDGKLYDIDKVPQLPAHPNCTCCIAPVVELKVGGEE